MPLSSSWGVDAKKLAIWEAVQEALAPAGGEDDEAAEAADVTSEEWQVALAQKLYGEEAKAGSPGFYEVKKVVALGVYEGERAAPPDDPTYEPSFDDEKTQRHGYGVLLLPKGDVYVGHFDGGKKAGVGAYVHKSGGGVYVGEWKADKKHGEGRMAFKDGAVYDGSWRHHKRHGRGVYRYVNGDNYVGQWFTGAKRAPPPPPRHRARRSHASPPARAITADGAADTTRPILYMGQAQVMSAMGPLPLQFPLEADSLAGAVEMFPAAAEEAVTAKKDALEAAKEAGANILVSGSTIFKENNGDLKKNINLLREK